MRLTYRDVFFAKRGFGPWRCRLCRLLIEPQDLHIHHKDRDRTNSDPRNLEPLHESCHGQLHKRGKRLSAETRHKMSESHKGVPRTPEHRANISRGLLGRKHTDEAKQKMSISHTGVPLGPERAAQNRLNAQRRRNRD